MFIISFMIGAFVGIFLLCLVQINGEKKECLHCGKGAAKYCEKCFQDLISENAKLQAEKHIRKVEFFKDKNEVPKMMIFEDTPNHIPRID